ncbi:hypothetical protein [Burkholderia pyrrocinia]|nr:hypothetical protein [Burkholderia pyrrocinia]
MEIRFAAHGDGFHARIDCGPAIVDLNRRAITKPPRRVAAFFAAV